RLDLALADLGDLASELLSQPFDSTPCHHPLAVSHHPDRDRSSRPERDAAADQRRPPRSRSVERAVTVNDACPRVRADESVRAVQHGFCVPPLPGGHAGRQFGPLPEVVMSGLRHRDVEPVVEPRLQALQDRPLFLQRLAANDLELPADDSDHHGSTVSAGGRAAAASTPFPAGGPGERAGDGLDAVALDDVAHLDVVETGDAQAALEALAHLPHVILEALEAGQLTIVDL